MAATTDKLTDTRNAARPNSARVSSGRSAGGTTLACDNLTGWPTASKVHFVTYQIDSSSNPVAGTQLDCYGIVSGNNINSFTVVDGTDAGNVVNDVVEMLPTAAWGQDLADALTAQHSRTGAHGAITTTSISNAGTLAQTGVATFAANPVFPANSIAAAALVGVDKSLVTTDSNPYKFSAQATSSQTGVASATNTTVTLGTENFDTNNNFAANTYTAPVAGFYQFNAAIAMDNSVEGSFQSTGQARLLKNGSTEVASVQNTFDNGWSADNAGVALSALVQLAATDTIVLQGQATVSSGTVTFQSGAGTQLSGFLVSRT